LAGIEPATSKTKLLVALTNDYR